MDFKLPDIPAEERTPLVLELLDLLQQQQVLIQQLRDEIARLKGQTRRPKLAPSRLEQTPKPKPPEGTPQPGGPKVAKNAQLRIDAEVTLLVAEPPAGSVVKGYEEYLVQELRIEPRVTRYLRQRVVTPDGRSLLAPLPADVLPGSHYGPRLRAFLLHQHHHNGVTQPLLLGQLHEWGIVISAGQLNHLLTEGHEAFHREKQELLPAGLIGAAYIQVDDTTARHQGQNGFCTHLGNERFAYFESTDSKSRQNFLEILRQPHTDYVINEMALAYWQRQGLSAEVVRKLCQGAQRFADKVAWQARLQELGIAAQRYVRLATEGALLGSLIEHGVSAQLRVLSDGAEQYNVLVHAACWVHAERPLARLEPFGEEHRVAIAVMREQIWELYQDLKAYQQQPDPALIPALEYHFDVVMEQRTHFASIDGVLKEMQQHKADLLRVLACPAVPLHNNTSEGHIREYVKKRKISGGTRGEQGRRCRDTFASLKQTCRCLGLRFWDYLLDRLQGLGQIPRLAEVLRQRTAESQPGKVAAVPT